MFIRRLSGLSAPPQSQCSGGHLCPAIFELVGGDFAVIGADISSTAHLLPTGSGCGPEERIVRIPRRVLVEARPLIPEAT
jgi:hypothetical protein